MRASDPIDTEHGEGKGQCRGVNAKNPSFLSIYLWVQTSKCSFSTSEDHSEDTQAERVTTSHKSPSLSLNATSVKLMQHSSPPLPLISCFHPRHVYSWPSLIGWFSQADARPGVFSHSPSLVAVTQEAFSFHYQAFPRQLLSQTDIYGNTAAESSPALSFMNQWNMLQTLENITPWNTLPRQHPRSCP